MDPTWRGHSWDQPHNAHHLRMVAVQYRWHPHFSVELAVRREGGQNRQQLLCELPDGTLSLIPKWMTEVDVCAGLSVGNPQVSVSALRRLREITDAVARGRGQTTCSGEGSKSRPAGES